jgi:phosphohistidine swiveling domain-containing protein
MKQTILSKEWVWFWSGNWTFLDNFYQRDPLFQKEFNKLLGDFPKTTLDFYRDSIVTCYHAQEEYDRLKKSFINKFNEDPYFIIKIYKEYHKKTNNDLKQLKKIHLINFTNKSNNELVYYFKKSRKYFAYNGAMDHFCWYVEKYFIPLLEKYLTKRKKELDLDLAEAINLLVMPQQESRTAKERKSFRKILNKINNNKNLKNYFINYKGFFENEIKKDIEKHLKEFSYLQVLVNNPPLTKEQLINELHEYIIKEKELNIESVRLGDNISKEDLIKRKNLIKKIKPNKKYKILIESLSQTAFIRTEDNMLTGLSTFYILNLQKEICKRINITYKGFKQLTPEEIIFYLRHHVKVPKNLIKERLKLCTYYFNEENGYLIPYKEGLEILNHLENKNNGNNELKGQIASKGNIKAKAFVVKSSLCDMSNFKDGMILITPATSADFVPYMKKASGIITEMGGITSHAAIVSRELGIPCIVGVKNITKNIKTNQVIELNANEGIINKI